MILKRPRDFYCFNQYRNIMKVLGESSAIIVLDMLWIHLGYQVEVHGVSGFLERDAMGMLLRELPIPQPQLEKVVPALLQSKLLRARGEHFECPLFTYYNPEIDANYIPDDSKWHLYDRARSQYVEDSSETTAKIPKDSWVVNGEKVTPADMNRIVMLVKTVDGILKLGKRTPAEFDPPLIHAASRVIREFSEAQLSVVLKRLWLKKNTSGIPRSTAQLLNDFNSVMIAIMPNDGFLKWAQLNDPHAQTAHS